MSISKWKRKVGGWAKQFLVPNIPQYSSLVMEQQHFKNLERYIHLTCNLKVAGNVSEATHINQTVEISPGLTVSDILNLIPERFLGKSIKQKPQLKHYAIIHTCADFKYRQGQKQNFMSDPLFNEYTKYKQQFLDKVNFPPVVLLHPGILAEMTKSAVPDMLYQIDGMHRIMSALEANVNQLDAFVLIRRKDLQFLIDEQHLNKIRKSSDECSWFPHYQEIQEVGIAGSRPYAPRYTEIYDFSFLKDKVVVDFGGNTGQAALEAYFCGASKVFNFDYQECAIQMGQNIANALGIPIHHNTIDFNAPEFEQHVGNIVPQWDWAIYQAIYRTKEIVDVKKSFDFIVKNSREGLIFEGNGDPEIDTVEYYMEIFKPYQFSNIKFIGFSQQRPAFIIHK
jgi:hypothetical protein